MIQSKYLADAYRIGIFPVDSDETDTLHPKLTTMISSFARSNNIELSRMQDLHTAAHELLDIGILPEHIIGWRDGIVSKVYSKCNGSSEKVIDIVVGIMNTVRQRTSFQEDQLLLVTRHVNALIDEHQDKELLLKLDQFYQVIQNTAHVEDIRYYFPIQ